MLPPLVYVTRLQSRFQLTRNSTHICTAAYTPSFSPETSQISRKQTGRRMSTGGSSGVLSKPLIWASSVKETWLSACRVGAEEKDTPTLSVSSLPRRTWASANFEGRYLNQEDLSLLCTLEMNEKAMIPGSPCSGILPTMRRRLRLSTIIPVRWSLYATATRPLHPPTAISDKLLLQTLISKVGTWERSKDNDLMY